MNAARREIVAGPGTLWKEFDEAAGKFRLATTGGQVSHTGIAGLTLGGGLGYLMGKHGAVCDNLLSVEMVTAQGEVITASEETNAELFWAMPRGGRGILGVVTAFRYRLHPLPGVLAGLLLHPRERTGELIAFYREYLKGTPDELDTTLGFLNAPDGSPLVGVVVVWAGDIAEGEEVLRPLRQFGPPVADLIQPMPYTAAQSMLDAAVPTGNRYYWKSNFGDTLGDELGDVLKRGADAMASPLSMILLFEIKGAIRRVPKERMAFDHRDPQFEMSIIANWMRSRVRTQRTPTMRLGARSLGSSAALCFAQAVYANHMPQDEPVERVRASYGEAKFAKLAGTVKRRKVQITANPCFVQQSQYSAAGFLIKRGHGLYTPACPLRVPLSPIRVIERGEDQWQDSCMRVNLISHVLRPHRTGAGSFPTLVNNSPQRAGLPGEYGIPEARSGGAIPDAASARRICPKRFSASKEICARCIKPAVSWVWN